MVSRPFSPLPPSMVPIAGSVVFSYAISLLIPSPTSHRGRWPSGPGPTGILVFTPGSGGGVPFWNQSWHAVVGPFKFPVMMTAQLEKGPAAKTRPSPAPVSAAARRPTHSSLPPTASCAARPVSLFRDGRCWVSLPADSSGSLLAVGFVASHTAASTRRNRRIACRAASVEELGPSTSLARCGRSSQLHWWHL